MTDELISEYGDDLESITLLKGGSGVFEVSVDGRQVFSKRELKRHPEPGEILKAIGDRT